MEENELYHYGVLGMKWGVRKLKPGYSAKKGSRGWAIKNNTKEEVRAGEAYEKNLQDAKQHERMNLLSNKVNELQKNNRYPYQIRVIQNPSWTTGSKDRYLYEMIQPNQRKTAAYESDYSRTFSEDEFQQVVAAMGGGEGEHEKFEKEVDSYLKDLNKRRKKENIRRGKIHARNYLRKFGRDAAKSLNKFIDGGKKAISSILSKIKSLFA